MRLLPRSLFGRLVLLMASGLVLAQLIGAAMHLAERQRTIGTTVGHEFAQRVAAIHQTIDSHGDDEKTGVGRAIEHAAPTLVDCRRSPDGQENRCLFRVSFASG